jgi:alpha-L-rhamnosidase
MYKRVLWLVKKNIKMKIISKHLTNSNIKVVLFSISLLVSLTIVGQEIESSVLNKKWDAQWITVPKINPTAYGVYYFRKSFEISSVPKSLPIHVSADNRYKLYVNQKLVSLGPARGDIQHWNFETLDLAPYLYPGKNVIAAEVWNEGELRPEGHISLQTAFILQGGNSEGKFLNTNGTWKCKQDNSYSPIPVVMQTYYVAGPGEHINMTDHIKGWKTISYHDEEWIASQPLFSGKPKNIIGEYGVPNGWQLVPSSVPQMDLKEQRLLKTRKVDGISVPTSFPVSKTSIRIPANTVATLLLDQTFLTNAYPVVIFSGGKDAAISLSYQEALFAKYPEKGNRNEVDGKTMIGRMDSIISDGSINQFFTTLNWRTYRYVQLKIITKETPLVLDDLYGISTGYPFVLNSNLKTNNAEMQKILEIGWRTAKLCAAETYMDCPYYEQLQYIGDSRIQAMVSLYNSGDERLIRNALNMMHYSQQPEGVTASRHPSVTPQYISTFSLWYIGMLHDYMMYGSDKLFVKDKLSSSRQVLNFFKRFQEKDGSLKNVPYWNFTDWVESSGWHEGIAPIGNNGNSALLDLQLLWAYQAAADMEQTFGIKELATDYLQSADQLKKIIREKYWDNNRKLLADRPEKDLFSQHANTLAILTGLVDESEAKNIANKLLADTTLAPASIYFKYYLHQALTKAGMGDDYLKWLDKWKENINMGLTTWAETSEINTTRSDCHAWGSSPNIEFYRIILGIDSDAVGFTKVKIEPHLDDIKSIEGEIPHPKGKIKVKYNIKNNKLNVEIDLPMNTSGRFIWKGKNYPLKIGKNSMII